MITAAKEGLVGPECHSREYRIMTGELQQMQKKKRACKSPLVVRGGLEVDHSIQRLAVETAYMDQSFST